MQVTPPNAAIVTAKTNQMQGLGDIQGAADYMRGVLETYPNYAPYHYNFAIYLRLFASSPPPSS